MEQKKVTRKIDDLNGSKGANSARASDIRVPCLRVYRIFRFIMCLCRSFETMKIQRLYLIRLENNHASLILNWLVLLLVNKKSIKGAAIGKLIRALTYLNTTHNMEFITI